MSVEVLVGRYSFPESFSPDRVWDEPKDERENAVSFLFYAGQVVALVVVAFFEQRRQRLGTAVDLDEPVVFELSAGFAWLNFPVPLLALMILTLLSSCATGLLAAAFAPPLPPLRQRSLLFSNLAWLVRFMLGAVLVLVAGFVGAVVAAQFQAQLEKKVTAAASNLLYGQILGMAAIIGLTIGAIVFAASLWLLGRARRLAAVRRGLIWFGGRSAARWIRSSRIHGWLDHLVSDLYLPMMALAGIWAVAFIANGFHL